MEPQPLIFSDLKTAFEAYITSPEDLELNKDDLKFWNKVVISLKKAGWKYDPNERVFTFDVGFPKTQIGIAHHSMRGYYIEFKVNYLGLTEEYKKQDGIITFSSSFNEEDYNSTFLRLVGWVQSKMSQEFQEYKRKDI